MSTRKFLNSQQGIRQTNSTEYEEALQKYTPVSQQNVSSHVATPALIAFIIALVLSFLSMAIMLKRWGGIDVFYTAVVFGVSFLSVFLWRIGVADKVLWAIEEALNIDIDNDGSIGYAPRSIPLTKRGGTTELAVSDQPETLHREDWQQVAIALLNKGGNVSRRGIYKNSKLSQSKAQLAATHLQNGYSNNGVLNGMGWDWLAPQLPDNVQCRLERPDPPHPIRWWLIWLVQGINQPTNQPTVNHDDKNRKDDDTTRKEIAG